ncbi:MAG TPA: hypothetical protein PLH94_02885 [Fimbriimonadaceae bacterium]|nr:hypothetical protein [Fimbriimonadaceae bacterium]
MKRRGAWWAGLGLCVWVGAGCSSGKTPGPTQITDPGYILYINLTDDVLQAKDNTQLASPALTPGAGAPIRRAKAGVRKMSFEKDGKVLHAEDVNIESAKNHTLYTYYDASGKPAYKMMEGDPRKGPKEQVSFRVVNFTKGKATVSTGVQSLAKDLGSMQASEIVDLNKGDTKLTVTVDGKKVGEMRELTGPAEAYMIAISYDRQGKPRAMMVRNSARTVPMTATPQ